jgi:hypothetical protein
VDGEASSSSTLRDSFVFTVLAGDHDVRIGDLPKPQPSRSVPPLHSRGPSVKMAPYRS